MAKAKNLDDTPLMRMPKELHLGPVVIPSIYVRLVGFVTVFLAMAIFVRLVS